MIQTLIDGFIKEEPRITTLSTHEFSAHLSETFNAQNYLSCFYYMKRHVDFEGSPARSRWYMKSVYVNIGIHTWLWIKDGKTKDGREDLLRMYDAVALNQTHDQITIDDFTQLTQNLRGHRERKRCRLSQVNQNFVSVGMMPAKATHHQPAEVGARYLDELEEDHSFGGHSNQDSHDLDTRDKNCSGFDFDSV